MQMKNGIKEEILVRHIARNFMESPLKLNKCYESDAEIMELGKDSENLLAITTDSLAEELASGLYDDPYLAGWMLATVNLSDLAAVGAEPLGLVISLTLNLTGNDDYIERFTRGLHDACENSDTHVLGGDTNQGESNHLCGCAVGLLPNDKIISRVGAKPGDKIYLSGKAGIGNIYAFTKLTNLREYSDKIIYKPSARLREGRAIRKYANCCIDTSDGVLHAVDTLMRLNGCKFVLFTDWQNIICPEAIEICKALNMPSWLTMAGVHGEFELCFTMSPGREDELKEDASRAGWSPVLLGEVSDGSGVFFKTINKEVQIDTAAIRNLAYEYSNDIQSYSAQLIDLANQTGII